MDIKYTTASEGLYSFIKVESLHRAQYLRLTVSMFQKAYQETAQRFSIIHIPVTLGKAVVFVGYTGFLNLSQLASHNLATEKVTKKEIPNPKLCERWNERMN